MKKDEKCWICGRTFKEMKSELNKMIKEQLTEGITLKKNMFYSPNGGGEKFIKMDAFVIQKDGRGSLTEEDIKELNKNNIPITFDLEIYVCGACETILDNIDDWIMSDENDYMVEHIQNIVKNYLKNLFVEKDESDE